MEASTSNLPPPPDADANAHPGCECSAAGWCERYKKQQSEKHRAICSGTSGMTPERAAVIKGNWQRQAAGERPKRQPAQKTEGLTDAESQSLFGSDDPTLLGNRIAALTTAIGIPPCGGCGKRQEWLNRAHAWLRGELVAATCNSSGPSREAE